MNKNDFNKKKVMDEIAANDFARLNGSIMRTMGMFAKPWLKGSNLMDALKDQEQTDIYSSLDYLQQCNFINVRLIDTKETVEIYDFDLDEVEIRATADGIKLLMCRKKDELIEI